MPYLHTEISNNSHLSTLSTLSLLTVYFRHAGKWPLIQLMITLWKKRHFHIHEQTPRPKCKKVKPLELVKKETIAHPILKSIILKLVLERLVCAFGFPRKFSCIKRLFYMDRYGMECANGSRKRVEFKVHNSITTNSTYSTTYLNLYAICIGSWFQWCLL